VNRYVYSGKLTDKICNELLQLKGQLFWKKACIALFLKVTTLQTQFIQENIYGLIQTCLKTSTFSPRHLKHIGILWSSQSHRNSVLSSLKWAARSTKYLRLTSISGHIAGGKSKP
jgi:hypothetical protein